MNLFSILFDAVWAFLVVAFLIFGTFFILFFERFIRARFQHREGPGRKGSFDFFQVWRDFVKIQNKHHQKSPFPLRYKFTLYFWALIPVFFQLVLLSNIFSVFFRFTDFSALLLLPLVSAALEATFLHASLGGKERIEWRKRMIPRLMGGVLLSVTFLPTILHVGTPSLSMVSSVQSSFPFHLILSSPGLFLCGLSALGAIFLFSNEGPIQREDELSLGGMHHHLIFFTNKMWVFCLLCFWVFVFWGGVSLPIAKILFPLKVFLGFFVFCFLQESFPRIRSSDAGELAADWLLPLCLSGFLLEVLWVGVAL